MTKAEFEKISKRIEDAYRDPFTEGQFNEWYEIFKGESYEVVHKAVTTMLFQYRYFPVPATLWAYISQVKATMESEEEAKIRAQVELPGEIDRQKGQSWTRFSQWVLETDKKMLVGKDFEQVKAIKARFEKEHPNWQPPKQEEKSNQPEQIGDIFERGVT